MRLNRIKVLGIDVTTEKRENILEYIKKYLDFRREKQKKSLVIATPNPEQIVYAGSHPDVARILNRADVAIPDGIGVAWAANVKRLPGVEFLEDLVAIASKRGYTVGLIGGYGGLAVRALECLSRHATGLRGWAIEPEGYSLQQIAEKIRKTNTRIVFVGLGAPKQEFFIEELISALGPRHSALVLMSVGGSFDILSGSIQRAPVFMRLIGLEWLWRLFKEPWRFRRQLALVQFARLVLHEKLAS